MKINKKKHKQSAAPKARPTDSLMNTCAWCGVFVATDSPATRLSLRVKSVGRLDESLMQKEEGCLIWLIPKTFAKPLPAYVPPSDSPARSMGLDFVMMCCSEKCTSEARATLLPGFDVHAIVHHSVIGSAEPVFLDNFGN